MQCAGTNTLFPIPGFEFSAESVAEFVRSFGIWGMAVIVGLMILHSFLPFPAEFVAIAAGICYGPVLGTLLTWSGAMLGAFLSFALARCLGRPFVERMLRKETRLKLDRWVEQDGAGTLLFSRFMPVIAFNLINYAAGLTRVSWWTFAWTTGVGILPLTVLMVVIGDRMIELSWWELGAATVAVLALWLGAHFWRKRFISDER